MLARDSLKSIYVFKLVNGYWDILEQGTTFNILLPSLACKH